MVFFFLVLTEKRFKDMSKNFAKRQERPRDSCAAFVRTWCEVYHIYYRTISVCVRTCAEVRVWQSWWLWGWWECSPPECTCVRRCVRAWAWLCLRVCLRVGHRRDWCTVRQYWLLSSGQRSTHGTELLKTNLYVHLKMKPPSSNEGEV